MNQNIMLTVLIPTYNREDCLRAVLKSLSEQKNQNFKVVVSDNASDYDVKILMEELPPTFRERCKLYQRRINCYADINIFDLFTLCETKFAWTLSDDEYLYYDAVDKIYQYIEKMPNIGVFNFTLIDEIAEENDPQIISSINQFIDFYYDARKNRNKWHGDLIFLSNKVFNLEMVKPYISWGYRYIYTRIATEVIFLKMLEQNIPYCIVQDRIVDYNSDNPRSWRIYEVILASRTLIDIPLENGEYSLKRLYSVLTFDIRYVYYLYFYESPAVQNVPLFFEQIYYGIYKYCLKTGQKGFLRLVALLTKSDWGFKLCRKIFPWYFKEKEKLLKKIRGNRNA